MKYSNFVKNTPRIETVKHIYLVKDNSKKRLFNTINHLKF